MKKIILCFLVLILTCLNASGISYTIRNNIEPDRFYISKLANADQSIDLYLTVTAGHNVYIKWGDGNATTATANGTNVKYTHAYATAGAYTAFVYGELSYVTSIKCYSEPISVVYTLAEIKERFPRLELLYLYATSSVLTGGISDLPSTIKVFSVRSTSSVITGSLSDMPSGMWIFSVFETSSIITGGITHAPYGIQDIRLYSTSMTQANVNDVINRIYADRASFTYATPQLQIGGTNPDPSGTYQAACPPTTALEKVYELVNDSCAEGFKKWTITY